MTRPLRIEFPGAVQHLTSRGDRREAIGAGVEERARFLAVLAQTLERFRAKGLSELVRKRPRHFAQVRQPAGLFLARQNRPAFFCFSTDPI